MLRPTHTTQFPIQAHARSLLAWWQPHRLSPRKPTNVPQLGHVMLGMGMNSLI